MLCRSLLSADGDGPEAIRHQFLGGGIPSGDLSRPRMPATPVREGAAPASGAGMLLCFLALAVGVSARGHAVP
jgi:hypothetical protein